MQLSAKQVWTNYSNGVIKVSRTKVITHPLKKEETPISNLIKGLRPRNSKLQTNILLTELLQPIDQPIEFLEFDLGQRKEMKCLLDRKSFRVILKEYLERDANIRRGRFVLTSKKKCTNEEIFKARVVVRGHLDREMELLGNASTTVSQQSIRFLFFAEHDIWIQTVLRRHDLSLHPRAGRIIRNVYVKGKPEFQLSANQLLQVLRLLYGLTDSVDYFPTTLLNNLKKDIGMQ